MCKTLQKSKNEPVVDSSKEKEKGSMAGMISQMLLLYLFFFSFTDRSFKLQKAK